MSNAIDLNRIQIFTRVVMAGSFTKAALMLGQPKSRISRQISSLEKELGLQLIHRTTRQFQLTEAGRLYYQQIKDHLDEIQSATQGLSRFSEKISGKLRITAPEDIGVILMPKLVQEFLGTYPDVSLELIVTDERLDLINDSIDLAIRVGAGQDSSLVQRKIGHIRFILVGSPQLIDRHGSVPQLESLHQWPCLNFSPRKMSSPKKQTQWTLQKGKMTKKINIDPRMSVNNLLILREMAILGQGLAFLPQFMVDEPSQKGHLIHLLKDWSTEGPHLNLTRLPQKVVLPSVRRLSEFLVLRLGAFFN